MPRWIHERKNEHYYLKAKEEGYRSRATYKLKQLSSEFGFFIGAHKILDLGAAPGGWLQVASEALHGEGLVLGVDLKEIEPFEAVNVETIVGDATSSEIQEEVLSKLNGRADVILSDMAPNVTGIWDLDDLRQINLARTALKIADKLLEEEGWMVVKVFQGPHHEAFIDDMKAFFKRVYIIKPKASRKRSAEVYLVAKGIREDSRLPVEEEQEAPPEEEKPLPGENLPDYGEPKEYKPNKSNL